MGLQILVVPPTNKFVHLLYYWFEVTKQEGSLVFGLDKGKVEKDTDEELK